ncbi:MAG: glycosyltransferase family 2 protein [Clostridium sp.]|jgi:GT2 family glycosyltransferase|uniref:glycosyltransferase family 2 protein n=1 Tax=Clostridium sp. TaxID=1506 RepID=UPI0025B8FC5B|nr:glycosyltransferase family 2 protein [Clostridium sp.]MCH3964309.1 glycosyltransferase family 2 protein [Clostridium sp.]MCI1715484.1 glycosyltransferase family 2 protein [Clostridium sp.]MCI1799724.1 glycosyltransferase family 2 protein [Clostridium sp.]MCI1813668.1 glycosyltransferase family 2 protein [Clostridium sp.]MCI1870537.1 glycosyltransferase family 2 protein [Clostridium sp.]
MIKLAVVICNYNKKNYILKCIESVMESSFKNLDIYVVDNASTDESVQAIRQNFSGKLTLIENAENLGGSGGFNTGLKEVLKKDYRYILLLDNDVIMDKEAILNLYDLLENSANIAIAGSKLYSMNNPKQIQELGAVIDFSKFYIEPFYKGHIDDGTLPEVIECDYVPACSMIVRVDAVKRVGIMDEANFIYWDDIDWGYRFKLAGYKVVSCSKSMVWHNMGVSQKVNTFGTYYFWRNRVHFFTKYCNEKQIKSFSLKLFDEIFQAVYSCNYIGKYSSARTIMRAVDDALNGIRGKAGGNRIMQLEKISDKFNSVLEDKNNILIVDGSELKILRDVINRIRSLNKNARITVAADNEGQLANQFENLDVLNVDNIENLNKYDCNLKTCYHMFDARYSIDDKVIYVDRFFNIIASDSDREYVKNYDNSYNMLKNIWYPILLNKILELKQTFED